MKKLGKLTAVKLEKCFPHEALNFTPWLAEAENLEELGATLDMELELEGTEVPVGPYRADIVARDGGELVVVENQFGKTNHDHLGKTITYAAGLQAKAIVWIAETFSDDHRRAFDFLNEVTTKDLRLYGIEMRLFKIGDSDPAPQFQVVARPNEYLRAVTTGGSSGSTDTQQLYLRFWTAWRDFVRAYPKTKIRPIKPMPQHWSYLSIGRSDFTISLTVSSQKRRAGCELYITGSKANVAFDLLAQDKEAIEKVTGALEWMPLKSKQACRIVLFKHDLNISDEASWLEVHSWLLEQAERFDKAFRARVKKLDLNAANETEEESQLGGDEVQA